MKITPFDDLAPEMQDYIRRKDKWVCRTPQRPKTLTEMNRELNPEWSAVQADARRWKTEVDALLETRADAVAWSTKTPVNGVHGAAYLKSGDTAVRYVLLFSNGQGQGPRTKSSYWSALPRLEDEGPRYEKAALRDHGILGKMWVYRENGRLRVTQHITDTHDLVRADSEEELQKVAKAVWRIFK